MLKKTEVISWLQDQTKEYYKRVVRFTHKGMDLSKIPNEDMEELRIWNKLHPEVFHCFLVVAGEISEPPNFTLIRFKYEMNYYPNAVREWAQSLLTHEEEL